MKLSRLSSYSVASGVAVTLALASAGCASGGASRPATSSRQAVAPCSTPVTDPAQVVNANRPAQDPQVFAGVSAGMCLSEVLDRLGPAHHFVASSLFQFEWKATDNRTFEIGVLSLRDKISYARWSK
jgi:hypothetical protein